MQQPLPRSTRRQVIRGLGASVAFCAVPAAYAQPSRASGDGFRTLRASAVRTPLLGAGRPQTPVLGYEGVVPGPTLRFRRGEELKVRLLNELTEPSLIHWHGLRLSNAMDGALNLTQAAIEPGKVFDYRFTLPDAGTYWYHAAMQRERGLYGPLIVDEAEKVDADRDLVLTLDDWPVSDDGSVQDKAGANILFTVNGENVPALPVRPGERVRLRLINASHARVFALRIETPTAWVMAIDGQPAEPFPAREGRIALGPGNRVDLFVDIIGQPGSDIRVMALTDSGAEAQIARLAIEAGANARGTPRNEPKPLPANALPTRLDFKSAYRLDIPLDTITSPDGQHGPALFSVKRGRTVSLALRNSAGFARSLHLHGHHVRLLDNLDDGWKPFWLDTVLVNRGQTARIAFVADNPGKWLIESQPIGSQQTATAAWFEVN